MNDLLQELYDWAADQADSYHARRSASASKPNLHKARGESSGKAKLNEAQVREIRALRAAGWKYSDLSAKYGVHKSTLQYVMNRGWKHV